MNLSVTAVTRDSATAQSAQRQHAPLSALNPRQADVARVAGRVMGVPTRRTRPITFDSAL